MVDGRHMEIKKYAIIQPLVVHLHQILHVDIEISSNLNFRKILRKYEIQDGGRPPFWISKITAVN